MQNEDDLRGLAKIMEFMRAVSILFGIIHIYWFCYRSIQQWNINIETVDQTLLNFQRTTGLFSSILWTKLFVVLFLALSCLGTQGILSEKIRWRNIHLCLFTGFILFFLNWWILALPLPATVNTILYILTLTLGYIFLLVAGLWMSRLLKHNLMEDVFNSENESFMQETRKMVNEYSVNLPTKFWYQKRQHDGNGNKLTGTSDSLRNISWNALLRGNWLRCSNPFRYI
jgi:hypothetical protein